MIRPNATVRLQRLDEFLSPPAVIYQLEPSHTPFQWDKPLACTFLEAWFAQCQQDISTVQQAQPIHIGTMAVVPQQDDVWWLLEGQHVLATALLLLANLASHPDGQSLNPLVHACLRGGLYGQPSQPKLLTDLPIFHQALCHGADLWDNRATYSPLPVLDQIQEGIERVLLQWSAHHTPAHVGLQWMGQLLLRQTWLARLELPHLRHGKLFRQQPTPRKYQALLLDHHKQPLEPIGAQPPPRLQPMARPATKRAPRTKKPSIWITRILWALEWCHRHQAGAVTASQLAQLLSSHGQQRIAEPNMARAFRLFKQDRTVDALWEEPLPKRYMITPTGRLKLEELGMPSDLPSLPQGLSHQPPAANPSADPGDDAPSTYANTDTDPSPPLLHPTRSMAG